MFRVMWILHGRSSLVVEFLEFFEFVEFFDFFDFLAVFSDYSLDWVCYGGSTGSRIRKVCF